MCHYSPAPEALKASVSVVSISLPPSEILPLALMTSLCHHAFNQSNLYVSSTYTSFSGSTGLCLPAR